MTKEAGTGAANTRDHTCRSVRVMPACAFGVSMLALRSGSTEPPPPPPTHTPPTHTIMTAAAYSSRRTVAVEGHQKHLLHASALCFRDMGLYSICSSRQATCQGQQPRTSWCIPDCDTPPPLARPAPRRPCSLCLLSHAVLHAVWHAVVTMTPPPRLKRGLATHICFLCVCFVPCLPYTGCV